MLNTVEDFYNKIQNDFEIRFYNLKGQEIVITECQIEYVIEIRVDGVWDSSFYDADDAFDYYKSIFDQTNYLLIE